VITISHGQLVDNDIEGCGEVTLRISGYLTYRRGVVAKFDNLFQEEVGVEHEVLREMRSGSFEMTRTDVLKDVAHAIMDNRVPGLRSPVESHNEGAICSQAVDRPALAFVTVGSAYDDLMH
jgi:hypothetical protein